MNALGIDGGGTATRWALCGADGAVRDAGELPSITGLLFEASSRAALESVVAALRARIGGAELAGVVAGITGLTEGAPAAAVAAQILAAGLGVAADRIQIRDDMWIGYHAVFRPGEGHVVYAGTGSIGMHVREDGSVVRVGGRGMLIDDGGSAFWIGREALNLIWRRLDLFPDTGGEGRLAAEVFAEIGGASWDAVRSYVYGGGRTAVAMLARAVARADDDDARRLLHSAGQELARLALALVGRAGQKPVALMGRAAALHPAVLEGFLTNAPALSVRLEAPDAAVAAARLALVACGPHGQRAG